MCEGNEQRAGRASFVWKRGGFRRDRRVHPEKPETDVEFVSESSRGAVKVVVPLVATTRMQSVE